jgi:hypothetical protein
MISCPSDRNPHFTSLVFLHRDFSRQIVLNVVEGQTICMHIAPIFETPEISIRLWPADMSAIAAAKSSRAFMAGDGDRMGIISSNRKSKLVVQCRTDIFVMAMSLSLTSGAKLRGKINWESGFKNAQNSFVSRWK